MVREKAKAFCSDVDEALEDTDLEVASFLPKKRARKTPRRAGEQLHDERVSGELEEYKVNSYLQRCYGQHGRKSKDTVS